VKRESEVLIHDGRKLPPTPKRARMLRSMIHPNYAKSVRTGCVSGGSRRQTVGRGDVAAGNSGAVKPFFASTRGDFALYHGNALEVLPRLGIDSAGDLIFADPPYFLSNDGVTCQAGRMVSVNKGGWDRLESIEGMHAFNRRWLDACRAVMNPNATIWVSGTRHVIYSVGFAMQEVDQFTLPSFFRADAACAPSAIAP